MVASCQFQCEHRDNTADTNLMHFFLQLGLCLICIDGGTVSRPPKAWSCFEFLLKLMGSSWQVLSLFFFFFFFIENITFQFSLTIFCIFTYFEIKSNGKLFSQLIWNNINTLFLQLFDMPVSIQIIPMYNHVINF